MFKFHAVLFKFKCGKILRRYITADATFCVALPLRFNSTLFAAALNLAKQDGRAKYDDKAGVTNTTYAAEQNMSNQKTHGVDQNELNFKILPRPRPCAI